MQNSLKKQGALMVCAAALLAACGGGGGSSAVANPPADSGLIAGTDLPVAVQQSGSALLDFAKTQLAATSDKTDPLLVGDAKLAADDTAEPAGI